MFELPARLVACIPQPRRDGSRDEAEEESAELVSRCESAVVLLGPGTRLSSHGTHFDELCIARGAASRSGRGPGETISPARGKPSFIEVRFKGTRPRFRVSRRASTVAVERR